MDGLKIMAAAAVLAWSGASVAQSPPVAPLVRVEGVKSISPHVQVIPDNSVPVVPNVGFVVGSKGVLVIDTGLGAANGAVVAAAAAKLAKGKAIWLVATHPHPEHDLGAQAFPATVTLIRSREQDSQAEPDLNLAKAFASRTAAMAELLEGATFRKADVTFVGAHELDLGGVIARLEAMPSAHTDGDTIVWVPTDKVLFSGDLAMRAQPAITSQKATLASWKTALALEARFKPAIVVPSHGPLGDAGFIAGYQAYLDEVARRTSEAKAAGQSLEAATASVAEAMVARFPDRQRLAGAVRMAYGR